MRVPTFGSQIQSLVLEFEVDDPNQVKDDHAFRARLYELFMTKGDVGEYEGAALDKVRGALPDWAKGQATSRGDIRKHCDRSYGVVYCEALKEIIWDEFIDWFETGDNEVLGYAKYWEQDRLSKPFFV